MPLALLLAISSRWPRSLWRGAASRRRAGDFAEMSGFDRVQSSPSRHVTT